MCTYSLKPRYVCSKYHRGWHLVGAAGGGGVDIRNPEYKVLIDPNESDLWEHQSLALNSTLLKPSGEYLTSRY